MNFTYDNDLDMMVNLYGHMHFSKSIKGIYGKSLWTYALKQINKGNTYNTILKIVCNKFAGKIIQTMLNIFLFL